MVTDGASAGHDVFKRTSIDLFNESLELDFTLFIFTTINEMFARFANECSVYFL